MIAFPQYRRRARLALLLCALAAAAHAADDSCVAEPAHLPSELKLDGAIRLSSCQLQIAANGDMELLGKVTVNIDGRDLHCERLSYDAGTHQLKLSGMVSYEDQGLRVTGETGNYDDSGAQFRHAMFEFLQHPGRGEADAVYMHQANRIELENVVYTTCPPGSAAWQLRAQHITLDTRKLRGVGRNTRVVFKGLPILYLPWISFPLSSARETGLLFPTLGSSSRNGATLSAPWYWNIAPNKDLTFTPTIYSRRGIDTGVEYRLLTPSGSGILQANYLPDDHLTQLERSWLRLHAHSRFGDSWRAQVDAEGTSDTHYFEDFADGPQTSSTIFLPRDLRVGRNGEVWQLRAQLLQFQTLDDQLAAADRPYAELPRLTATASWRGTSGLGSDLDSELTDFQRGTGTTGWRARAQPGIGFEYLRPGFFLRPRADWDVTVYRLQDAPTADASPARSLPILSLDSGLRLERGVAQGARLVTLEPRAYYVYIPYRDQSALPVFDSGLPDPNFVALFRANRYTGYDRLGDANNLTLALTARMLNGQTGQRLLSATLGQTLHFSEPRVLLPGETPDTRRRSDLLANVELAAYHDWNLHYDLAWNPSLSQTEKSLLSLQYRPQGNQVVNVGYRYTRGSVEQAETSMAWPLARRWDFYGRVVYSVFDHRLIESFAGLQYKDTCWGMRVVVRDSVSNRAGTRDTGWYLQLELKGLSSVGSAADSFLLGSIQGYSPTSSSR
ncbi:MAG TPA: LPS assembly protein LptD [Steroidobacteraceae bacterium]